MEKKIKHLEFIQGIITRLSSHSFTLKGLCISIIAGILAFSFDTASASNVFLLMLIPIFSLWILDSFFLQLERTYRMLYDHVRLLSEDAIDFNLDISRLSHKPRYWKCLFSRTELCYYGTLLVFVAIIFVVLFTL